MGENRDVKPRCDALRLDIASQADRAFAGHLPLLAGEDRQLLVLQGSGGDQERKQSLRGSFLPNRPLIVRPGPSVYDSPVVTFTKQRFVLAAAILLFSVGTLHTQTAEESPRRVYQKTADSVVAVRAIAPLGERSGSGVILSKDGLILASYAVCPEGASNVRVWVKGPRIYPAEVVGSSKKDELVLLRIKPRSDLKPIELGFSATVRVGQISYTIGNAANSIILDDQPSFNVGIVSGAYRLGVERANSTYTGPVLETTAAVNVGMEGAPCLDAEGRMVGFVTLNYSPHRFLGTAIPIDEIRTVIDRLKESKAAETAETLSVGDGTLGLRVKEEDGKVVVQEVDKEGPADRVGLAKGDFLLEAGNTPVTSARDLEERLKGMEAGSIIWIKASISGKVEMLKLTLEKKK
jgi:S1-C subfamily serine protease